MLFDHVIVNGTVVTRDAIIKADIGIRGGKIAAIDDRLPSDSSVKTVTDAAGRYVLPGLIDLHVHSRDGRNSPHSKEDAAHATMAAACGGITMIGEMPNCFPAVHTCDTLRGIQECFAGKAYVDYGFWGMSLGAYNLSELEKMVQAGILGVKLFWGYALDRAQFTLIYNYDASMTNALPPPGRSEILDTFRMAARQNKCVCIHAENFDLINENQRRLGGQRFPNEYEAALAIRSVESETSIVSEAIALSRETGCRVHIAHVSAGATVSLIREAQRHGVPITAETAPHYLTLTNEDYGTLGAKMKVFPLIRTKEDRALLWEGIRDGTLCCIGSDHAPHRLEEKMVDFRQASAGMPGVETTSAVLLDQVRQGRLTIRDFVRLLSEAPAKLLHLYPERGVLQVGVDANITIVDLQANNCIDEQKLHSKAKQSPYHGRMFTGKAVATILRGETVMQDGEIIGLPRGTFVNASESWRTCNENNHTPWEHR